MKQQLSQITKLSAKFDKQLLSLLNADLQLLRTAKKKLSESKNQGSLVA